MSKGQRFMCYLRNPRNINLFVRVPDREDSGEARGPGSLGGPGSWYSHGQTAHSSREPRAGTPSRADPLPLALPKEVQKGGEGSRPEGGVPARRGVGVPARGILRPIPCQAVWEYHEPGPPNEPGPLAFSQRPVSG